MLALSNSVARTQIYQPWKRPYVSKKPFRPTPAQCPIIGNLVNPSSNHNLTTESSIRNNQPSKDLSTTEPESTAPVLAEQLPLFLERELIALYDDAGQGQAERVLEYLAKAESRELDPWARDDIHVAWLAVLYAARGFVKPWEYAFWSYYGKTPEKAIPIWLERWAARDAMLGPGLAEGEEVYPAKRYPQSEKSPTQRRVRNV